MSIILICLPFPIDIVFPKLLYLSSISIVALWVLHFNHVSTLTPSDMIKPLPKKKNQKITFFVSFFSYSVSVYLRITTQCVKNKRHFFGKKSKQNAHISQQKAKRGTKKSDKRYQKYQHSVITSQHKNIHKKLKQKTKQNKTKTHTNQFYIQCLALF